MKNQLCSIAFVMSPFRVLRLSHIFGDVSILRRKMQIDKIDPRKAENI
jgi:hypothetical protein